jgi:integrase
MLAGAIPDYKQIVSIAQEIPRQDIQALFSLAFLTGARVKELVGCRIPNTNEFKWVGLLGRNITQEHSDLLGMDFMVIKLHSAKQRKEANKILRIPYSREKELIDLILPFLELPQFDAEPNIENPYPDMLFPMNRFNAYTLLKKYSSINPHFLRHCRTQDLIVRYNLNDSELCKFLGWSTRNMVKVYDHLRGENMMIAMVRNKLKRELEVEES